MKKITFIIFSLSLVLWACAQENNEEVKFSVLGDSYSTYAGYVTPAWNVSWYYEGSPEAYKGNNDVASVDQTWWKLLDNHPKYKLDVNNSFSGSTICTTGYNGDDYSDRAFVTRLHNLGNPDIILIFGGTNDSWAKSPIGEYKYADWTKEDLYQFRPAMAYMFDNLKRLYPNARIVNILNSELDDEINASTDEICEHYGIDNIHLQDISKGWGHPTVDGMQKIYESVLQTIEKK